MSILNAWVGHGHALIGADTEAFAPGGESIGHFSKLVPLVHMNSVFGFRGQFAVFTVLHTLAVWRSIGFDALVDEMPALLAEAVGQTSGALAQVLADPALQAPLNLLDLVLVGYSPRERDVVGYAYSWDEDEGKFRGGRIPAEQGFFAPATEEWLDAHMPAAPVTGVKLAALAQHQVELVRAQCPTPAAGGQFVVAYIDRRGMAIRSVANLKR